ncbi:MAG: VTT domain-containing protein [Planctomycetales bacterium]|nr:VTT domain-containing protein [Planctomycetales bacterium]
MLLRRILFLSLFTLVVIGLGLGIHYIPDWEWIVTHEQQLRQRVALSPLPTWCVGVALYTLLSLIPGTAGKSVIAGWLFGFWAAVAMVEIGLTTAAILTFLLGRYAAGKWGPRRGSLRLRMLGRRFARDGAFYLLLLRLTHAPYTLVNYGAGASRVPLATFWWTTHLGILPGTAVFAFVGTRIPTLRLLAEQGVWSLVDIPLALALVATALLPLLVRLLLRSKAVGAWRSPMIQVAPPPRASGREKHV